MPKLINFSQCCRRFDHASDLPCWSGHRIPGRHLEFRQRSDMDVCGDEHRDRFG